MPLRFVWVSHYAEESLDEVKRVIKEYKPEVIGLELDEAGLEKLKRYRKREGSELYYGYQYAKRAGATLLLTDQDKKKQMDQALKMLGSLGLLKLGLLFSVKNLGRLFTGQRLRKLKVDDSQILRQHVLVNRDKEFIKQIRDAQARFKGKRLLFIFGRAHKPGIVKGLKPA